MSFEDIKKSILAPLLIACGVAVSLAVKEPLSAFLFAFGLITVCILEANLFTGKVGYYWRDKKLKLLEILFLNLVFGWLFGFLLSLTSSNLVIEAAQIKVSSWTFDFSFLIKSILCGVIMYLAVELYRRNNYLGILFGIPLFILSGFQHCIANIIVMGVARTFSPTIILCIIGNSAGSILTNLLTTHNKK